MALEKRRKEDALILHLTREDLSLEAQQHAGPWGPKELHLRAAQFREWIRSKGAREDLQKSLEAKIDLMNLSKRLEDLEWHFVDSPLQRQMDLAQLGWRHTEDAALFAKCISYALPTLVLVGGYVLLMQK